MYKKVKFSPFYLLLLLLSVQTVFAVEIKTSIDRNPVSLNESFQITYTANESPDDDPDFSPLDDSFKILNKSHNSQSSWINGQSSQAIQWVLDVMAKQAGKLLIPAISFGDDQSKPTSILVTKKSMPSTRDEDVFLAVEAVPERPFVQSQILYTLRLYRRVQITQASLTEPKMESAIIEKLGEDKNYNTEINGISYVVTERKYAIFPQKSGVTTIEPLVLQAKVVTSTRPRFNGFFNNPATRTKHLTSKAITLDVQAVPDDYRNKLWIPAEHLYVEEKWSGDTLNMKVGEPLTRTLTILSKGSTVAQLPELFSKNESYELKTYPDQPTLKEQKNDDGLIAFREEKIAYIPSKSGEYTLPAIEIPWFNTKTQKMEMAHIPERAITAISSFVQTVSPRSQAPISVESEKSNVIIQQVDNKIWMWVSIGLAFGWLVTIYFYIKLHKPVQEEILETPDEINLKESVKKLKKACADNNKFEAKDALLTWGKIKFNSSNLSTTASLCEARLRDELHALNQNLYANQTEPWNGKKLFQFFIENSAREKVGKQTIDALEPLYKV